VLLSLKENQFKAFLESSHFKSFLKTQPLQVLYEIGSVRVDSSLHYVENLGDLKNEHFSLNDFKFIKSQFSNYDPSEWELIGSSTNHKCYWSTKQYDMGSSIGLGFYKFDVIFPFNIKHVMNTIFEQQYRVKYDGNLNQIQQLNYVNKNLSNSMMASSITKEIYKLVWPLNNRDFIVSSSGLFDTTNDTYYVGKKSCESTKAPPPEKNVIRSICVGGWAFKEITPTSTKYSQLFFLDMKGNIPRSVTKTLVKDRAKNFMKVGTKYMKINEKRGFKCEESNLMWKTIEENGSITLT